MMTMKQSNEAITSVVVLLKTAVNRLEGMRK